jgi:hypothetical protein
MYGHQDLRHDGGVDRQVVCGVFERARIGEQSEYVIWGFKFDKSTEAHSLTLRTTQKVSPEFFTRVKQLQRLGLIEWIPYLFEGDSPEAEPIHVYGIGCSDSIEDRLGWAAQSAAEGMLTDWQKDRVEFEEYYLIPVLRHFTAVQLIAIARLRYRPHTAMTSAWWRDLHEKGEEWIKRYLQLTDRVAVA